MESLVEVEDFPGRLLHVAALWDNAELLEDLLNGDELSCLNSRDSWGRSALHAAATNASSRCLRILLQSGAHVDAACGVRGEGRTPLHVAAEHGHVENVQILIDHGASLLTRDHMGLTALDLAEKGEHLDCMEVLKTAADTQEKERVRLFQVLHEACLAGDVVKMRSILSQPDLDVTSISSIVNYTSGGSSTLLFRASELGHKDVVLLLLDYGADGRMHPVTKYSPLYVAAYNGHRDIVEILLKRFPDLIKTLTVEKWSALHAACINGHSGIFEFIMKFPFRKELLETRKDKNGLWEYDAAFDVNQVDVTGQSLLYLAVSVSSVKIVDLLLNYRVKARKCLPEEKKEKRVVASKDDFGEEVLVQRKKKSKNVSGITALLSRLRGNGDGPLLEDETWLNPVQLDVYCNNGTETALHNAVKRKETVITTKLLAAGADPNLVIYCMENVPQPWDDQFYFKGSSCLVEACKNRDIGLIELLLKYSAKDDDCKALFVAAKTKDDVIMSKLLSLKANQDLENEINRKGIAELNQSFTKGFVSVGTLAYNSIFPSTSVMINWHNQGCLTNITEQYLTDAAVRLNPKLKLSPKFQTCAIHAITRLDLSNNELTSLPECIWSMQSLRILNLAQNKLETLPSSGPRRIGLSALRSSTPSLYNCPCLEEIQLQDNRLQTLPAALFSLKSLRSLDMSNNKLQFLPFEMWTSTTLQELNLSFNLLSELPCSRNASDNDQANFVASDHSSIDSDLSETALDALDLDGDPSKTLDKNSSKSQYLKKVELNHNSLWATEVEVMDKAIVVEKDKDDDPVCSIANLNLSHNSFSVVPRCLACLCPELTRLSISFNMLSKCGSVTIYPKGLKHLDLSHNQINEWPGDCTSSAIDNVCYEEAKRQASPLIPSSGNKKFARIHKLSGKLQACAHKGHLRLDSLRTLLLSNNNLTHINFYSNNDCDDRSLQSEEGDNISDKLSVKVKILFPALSMLDVSNNEIHVIPNTINELVNLSVLNVSDNPKICDLPPQMGLLYKLWNLNTKGCRLQEPLLTMSTSKSYKTSDIIGYLRSILENSKPYARLKLMVVGIQGIGKTTLLEILRQEGGSFKRKPVEHWAKRMGNKNINMRTGKGVSISTVGVDIGDWTFEKKGDRSNPSNGPVVFRTWDFGGQTEYYSTHQYFLSKRSLYLVVWKITDGEKGMNEIQQWLINIQARAPNSPVIIVGTHFDVAKDEFAPNFTEYLQQKIREQFINITDPEKCGLPRVLESIEVSCKTKHNMKLLASLLYDTAFSLRTPGSKARLLEQKIPASYLALEDLIGIISHSLKQKGHDPVLNQEQYEETVNHELEKRFSLRFRDNAELNQATKFLHENGLLLHYDDATLRDLYFLDPQWLCDILSHVVTIREINPFAKNGIMKLEDLKHVFKSSTAISVSAKSYIVNLLNKFEVALTWDSRTLLIPSLLPTELQMRSGIPGMDMRVKIAVRTRGWGFRGRRVGLAPTTVASSVAAADKAGSARSRSVPSRALLKNKKISKPILHESGDERSHGSSQSSEYEITKRSEAEHSIHRLLLMSYFPSGFWSRLLTRVLADDSVVEIVRSYFIIPDEMSHDPILAKIFVEEKPEWVCWQTGVELRYMDSTLFSMKQVLPKVSNTFDYRHMRLLLNQEETWNEVDTKNSSILEVVLPQDTVVIKRPVKETSKAATETIGYQAIVLDSNPKSVCQLLALAVEHIDTLLEDWYPSLGTRFLHTSEGKMLVTRLVPCPRCLASLEEKEAPKPWQDWAFLPGGGLLAEAAQGVRVSQDSTTSDRDSGVGAETSKPDKDDSDDSKVYSFLIEECILDAFEAKNPHCPSHGDLILGQVAPDTVFLDLDERLRIPSDNIKQGELIGRGAFGFVYESACKQRGSSSYRNVAIKMLQPIDPGDNARASTLAAFKANQSKWERDPLQYACKSYCTARQELNILIHLKHSHIVPLVGICSNPLSIVLELAPLGALDQKLKHFRRSGDKLKAKCIQLIILQIAKALEYLHQHHIIYRDLKSENVLVWHFPDPFSKAAIKVHVKLADYGISRATLPTGAKGFGGTEGFMAPEIVRYNGEEEYTEKVDSFSFGMFIYELITLHQPFVGYESVKELILEGGRPPITYKELAFPTYILDLMVVSWSQQPRHRPSSSQLVSIATAPEFVHLIDVVSLDYGSCCASVVVPASKDKPSTELWMTVSSAFEEHPQLHVLEVNRLGWQEHTMLKANLTHNVTSMCLVNDAIWFGDNLGFIHAYSAKQYHKLFTYKMEPDQLEDASPIRSIHFLPDIQRACVAMHNGRMFLCCADVVPSSQEGCEGTFLITELGSETCIHSVTSIRKSKSSVEIWCGESQGAISIFTLTNGVVTAKEVINHNDPPVDNVEVFQVLSDPVQNETCPIVWSFIYPGCNVFQWHTQSKREIRNRLDCSKLVPSSESLQTIAIDEHFSPGRCQIASMAIQDQKLYVGTSWGCLIVADAISMRPISVFRPFMDEIQALIPIVDQDPKAKNEEPLLVSLGKGYRNLIGRFLTGRSFSQVQPDHEDSELENARTMSALLWRPDDWLCD